MKKERARTAGRVHDPLFKRVVHGCRDHAGSQPVGGVVFAKIVAAPRVNQALVEGFENIDTDIVKAESVHMPRNSHDQDCAVLVGQYPVEEIGLTMPGDAPL